MTMDNPSFEGQMEHSTRLGDTVNRSGQSVDSAELRFGFGDNWNSFLAHISEERIEVATESIRRSLGVKDLAGKRVLDIGSGSGLFSLAARRLGARVHSFDYDRSSVRTTEELKRRYRPDDAGWTIEQGSVLDESYLRSLGTYDIVYSWGVLHHTGEMWKALANVAPLVAPGGSLFISIYNDQGMWSRWWTSVKRTYNTLPPLLRPPFAALIMGGRELRTIAASIARGRVTDYIRSYTHYSSLSGRGMSRIHDMIDWVGGYPFEVAKPEEIFDFYRDLGFDLRSMRTCGGGLGCNEFVFSKTGTGTNESTN